MYDVAIILKGKKIHLEELILQIKKDFTLAGIDPEWLNKVKDEKHFVIMMNNIIEELLTYHSGLFHNLLYRVDINEKKIEIIQNGFIQWEFTKLIIEREIQKVYFRKKYSS